MEDMVSHSRFFDADPVLGIQRTFHWDDETETFTIESVQDFDESVLKAQFNQFDERTPWKGDFHQVASIPMTLWMKLEQEGIANDPKALKRWLNDRDNRVFRTRPGRV